jgi:GT2 family glycosyltransferase
MEDMHRLCIGAATENLSDENFELIGANMAFRRDVLAKVRGFDPDLGPGALGLGEDTLFSWQLLEAGYRLKLLKDVTVEHHFHPNRLKREAFVQRASSMGCSLAYLTYHWHHKVIPFARLRYLKASLRLVFYRILHRPKSGMREEGISLAEYDCLTGVFFYEQYLRERRRPFNYEKRGLVKLPTPVRS